LNKRFPQTAIFLPPLGGAECPQFLLTSQEIKRAQHLPVSVPWIYISTYSHTHTYIHNELLTNSGPSTLFLGQILCDRIRPKVRGKTICNLQ